MSRLFKLIIITGTTGSGKTALSLALAKKFHGVIFSADSRQVYRGMDIGTDKIAGKKTNIAGHPARIANGIPHFLMDLVNPDERFTLKDYLDVFYQTLQDVFAHPQYKNSVPFLVGGTGLYISAITDRYSLNRDSTPNKVESLQLGVDLPKEELHQKISQRVDEMIERGLISETQKLSQKYNWALPSMTGIGYRQTGEFLRGEISQGGAVEKIKKETRAYAKRQRTWWRHHGNIQWITSIAEAEKEIRGFLKSPKL